MTLNGRYAFCSRIDASFGAHHKNWMKIDPYCQRQKCRPLTLVSGDIRFTRYSQGFSGEGASNASVVIDNVDFDGFWTLRLRHLRKWGQHYYIGLVLFCPLSPFQWPQNIWPWITLTGYLAWNSVFVPLWLADTERHWKNNCVKTNKDRHTLSRWKSPARTLVSGDIRFVRIFGRVL